MSIQLASFVGSNLFTAADAPRYRKALLVCAASVLAAALLSLVWKLLYRYVDRPSSTTTNDQEKAQAQAS